MLNTAYYPYLERARHFGATSAWETLDMTLYVTGAGAVSTLGATGFAWRVHPGDDGTSSGAGSTTTSSDGYEKERGVLNPSDEERPR